MITSSMTSNQRSENFDCVLVPPLIAGSLQRRAKIQFNESNDRTGELFRLFQIHEMTCLAEHDAPRSANAGFNSASMSMYVRDVGIAGKNQRRDIDFV